MDHATCGESEHFTDGDGVELAVLDADGQLLCNHDRRPIFYCLVDEAWHHAERPEVGCFLIPAEGRD